MWYFLGGQGVFGLFDVGEWMVYVVDFLIIFVIFVSQEYYVIYCSGSDQMGDCFIV